MYRIEITFTYGMLVKNNFAKKIKPTTKEQVEIKIPIIALLKKFNEKIMNFQSKSYEFLFKK